MAGNRNRRLKSKHGRPGVVRPGRCLQVCVRHQTQAQVTETGSGKPSCCPRLDRRINLTGNLGEQRAARRAAGLELGQSQATQALSKMIT